MAKYRVLAIRDGKWWALEFPDVDRRIHSQVRRLEQAAAMAAEAISFSLDVEVSPADVEVVPTLSSETGLAERIGEAKRLRVDAAALTREANHAMQNAAAHAVDEGLSLRDAGRLLGISFQRVSQLMRDGA